MRPRRKEDGFALLMVFLLAACVAIMLYTEVPRIAFEAERQRELLLVDRGNQFKRAIQVFVTDRTNNPTHRFPASIDELESFNNHRYLRHRYKDPMTGKDEWRLVHINGGVLTDSVTTQNLNGKNGQSGSSTPNPPDYISQQSYIDTGTGSGRGGGIARAMNRRPSDSQAPGQPGDAGMTAGGSPGMQGFAGGGSALPGATPVGMPAPGGIPGLPGQPVQSGQPGGPPGTAPQQSAQAPCTVYIGGCPPTTANGVPGGVPPQPGMPLTSQSANGGAPGFGLPGAQVSPQAQSAAASMIQGLLTSARPGGPPSQMGGMSLGGGIAGVASKYEAEGIMVINDRTAINEWEYIFDQNKYRAPPNPVSGTVGTPQTPMGGGPGGTPIGTPIGNNPMTGPGGIPGGGTGVPIPGGGRRQ